MGVRAYMPYRPFDKLLDTDDWRDEVPRVTERQIRQAEARSVTRTSRWLRKHQARIEAEDRYAQLKLHARRARLLAREDALTLRIIELREQQGQLVAKRAHIEVKLEKQAARVARLVDAEGRAHEAHTQAERETLTLDREYEAQHGES